MAEIPELQRLIARWRGIEQAAVNLEGKLHEVVACDDWGAIFGIAAIHGFNYAGPDFADELTALSEALKEPKIPLDTDG